MKNNTIAKNIKKLRLFKNLNQSEFADLFDITRSSVGSYEEGRAEPRLETLVKIADYFKLTVDDIIRRELTVNKIAGFNYPQLSSNDYAELVKKVDALSAKINDMEEILKKLAK